MKSQFNFLRTIKNTLTTMAILLQIHLAHSQINYCDDCGIFINDNPELYKNVLNIKFKQYKGSPVFENLDENLKSKLLEETKKVVYNEFGKVEEYSSDSFPEKLYKFTYDVNRGVIDVRNEGVEKHKQTFIYDNEQDEITQYFYNYNDVEVDRIIKYKLNKNGLVLNEKEYFDDGILFREKSHKYDNRGNIIFRDSYGVKTTITYKFDEKGRIVSERSTNNYGKGFTSTFKYNENGKIIERIDKSDSEGVRNKITYEYENDLMISEKNIYGNNYIIEIKKYVYDEKGMWVKETTTKNGILTLICLRNINYRSQ